MGLTSTIQDETRVISVDADRIDAAMAIQFKDDMRTETSEGPDRVVLDLTNVDFIDSSGLGAIVGVLKYLGQKGTVVVAGVTTSVERVFQLTRMDRVFKIYPTVREALGE